MLKPNSSTTSLLSLALLSGGGLLLEIALTRLFSAVYYPPYVFAVLSLAVLGIGLGAALAAWRRGLRRGNWLPVYLALVGLSALALIVFAVLTAAYNLQAVLLPLVLVPYSFVGLSLATLFSGAPEKSHPLYMADLVGAGVGAALAIPVMNAVGPINSVLVVGVLFGLAALMIHSGGLPRLPALCVTLALVALGSNIVFRWLSLDMAAVHTDKPVKESLASGGRLLQTTWDSFARTDLVQPGDGGPFRLYIDGAAGSVMPPARDNNLLLGDIGFFPFATDQPQRVFVVGPGGGLDVWFGLQSGAGEIIAVEVNPGSVWMVEQYRNYHGNLYSRPSVRVVVDEGRSVLRRENTPYDLIFLSQVVTLAAERTGYALTENTIYTVEAFSDYLDHLTPEGMIALKLYDEITLTRALSTALAAFRARGLSDADGLRHMIALLDTKANPPIPLLMIRSTAFTRDDALVFGAIARDVGFTPLYLPDVLAQPPLDAVQAGTRPFSEVVAESQENITPTTDDHPFFFQFERGLPQNLLPLVAVIGVVIAAGGALVIYAQRRVTPGRLRLMPLYFAGLGIGFMTVEVAVIQQTRLFLGHPTLAVTAALATLLIGGGIGSAASGRLARFNRLSVLPGAAVVLVLVVWLIVWPLLSRQFLAAPPVLRVLIAVISLTPLALLMGIPFPVGLRAVGQAGDNHVALAWAVNGAMTVAGSVLAVTLAVMIGFNSVLVAGIAAYGVVAVLGLRL